MRNPDSHKGENGKVAIIGGSRHIHGAPIFSALAAEASGVDLVFLCIPVSHENVAKNASLNFQVHQFKGEELSREDTGYILQMLAIMDSCVIGPGLSRGAECLSSLEQIIRGAPCPLVLDATALQPDSLALLQGKIAVLTPHLGELERMGIAHGDIGEAAKRHGVTIHVKGPVDSIASPDGTVQEIAGGNAGLTVGGTGDALAGLIAGLIAQKMSPAEACALATTVIKSCGDRLCEEKGFTYTTRDVIEQIPYVLHECLDTKNVSS